MRSQADDAAREVMCSLLTRYEDMLATTAFTDEPVGTGSEHLLWMCRTARNQAMEWPLDKMSRWVGFVQGVLIMRGLSSVDIERDHSRPLFHEAYGYAPPTLERPA